MSESHSNTQNKDVLLYISTNDGSDTRINKEVRTLAEHFEIVFLGVGESTNAFVAGCCREICLIRGKRNRPWTIIRQVWMFLVCLRRHQVRSIHVVNEQLLVFFYPLLIGRHTVLDIFDSIFLRWNCGGERWSLLKRIVYWPANRIIVTDENRRELLPKLVQPRATVVENFPRRYRGPIASRTSGPLTLLFAGTLTMSRGGEFVQRLLTVDHSMQVIMAGWLHDEGTRRLASHSRVDCRGVIPQDEILRIAATEADYIVCIYPPTNQNNVHASPNKIWDALQTKTPVIINQQISVASLVSEKNWGIVVDQSEDENIERVSRTLHQSRTTFAFCNDEAEKFCWEELEDTLVSLHQRPGKKA